MRATRPTSTRDREPVLDLLRGFAVLGILLVNIEFMRGSDLYRVLAGDVPVATGSDRLVEALVGWLVAGKFVSSFSLLFGVGAGFLVARALRDGVAPRRLLARRYALLAVFGLAHMLVLFPGDVLFVYAVTGFVLLAFVEVRPRVALWWGTGLLGGMTVLLGGIVALGVALSGAVDVADDPLTAGVAGMFQDLGARAAAAYTDGGVLDVLGARAIEAGLIQSSQLLLLPWFLALFLVGFALQRQGVVTDLAGHRPLLRRVAFVGIVVGLPLNLPGAFVGTLGAAAAGGSAEAGWIDVAAAVNSMIGAPILAAGYLATLALVGLRLGAWWPLAATGRMALSAYLAQSALTTVLFVGFGRYDTLSATAALGVVVAIWGILLVVCPLWLRVARFGPVEWLWRSWTYRRWQPLRREPQAAAPTPAAPD